MRISPRYIAILQAFFVTFLWSTSWILIKRNISEIPPLTFAGLRYFIAFLILLPGLLRHKTEVRSLSSRDWGRLVLLGILFYTLTQGGQFLTLKYLEAITFSLLMNFTTLIVALIGIMLLREIPSRTQWAGIFVFMLGVLLYFYPAANTGGSMTGLLLAGFTVCANAFSSVLGRSVNRGGRLSPLVVTVISMGVGATILLGIGLFTQGLPPIRLSTWLVILWLALVNTAFAFLLWNRTLQTLSAVESSIINSTMLIQIAVLAWVFLGEGVSLSGMIGLALAAVGVVLVNLKRA